MSGKQPKEDGFFPFFTVPIYGLFLKITT